VTNSDLLGRDVGSPGHRGPLAERRKLASHKTQVLDLLIAVKLLSNPHNCPVLEGFRSFEMLRSVNL
jgi:hypothetical protein